MFFAGTAGSIPTARRGLPALLVRRGGDRILFDCGEGTQRQLVSSVGLTELTEIFLTHFHADHWLGLPGMLKTFDLRGRERPLPIHGPPGLRELIALALRIAGRVRFELELVELEPGDVLERDGYRIAPVPVAPPRPGVRLRAVRGRAPGRVRPRPRPRLGLTPGPRVRARAARRDGPRRRAPSRCWGRPARAQARDLRATRVPCETLRIAAHRRRPAGPRGDVRRGGARAGRRDRPLDRRPGGDARPRGRGRHARAHPLLDPLSGRACCATRRGRCSRATVLPARLRHDRDPVPRARRARARALGRARRRPAARARRPSAPLQTRRQ